MAQGVRRAAPRGAPEEGAKAIAQLALQAPDGGSIAIQALREHRMQRPVTWVNKPQAEDPCIATFPHTSTVESLAVSATRIVGGAGDAVFVYDAATEALLGKLEGASEVKSVGIYEDHDGGGLIVAGYGNGRSSGLSGFGPNPLPAQQLTPPAFPAAAESQEQKSSAHDRPSIQSLTTTMGLRSCLPAMAARSKSGIQR